MLTNFSCSTTETFSSSGGEGAKVLLDEEMRGLSTGMETFFSAKSIIQFVQVVWSQKQQIRLVRKQLLMMTSVTSEGKRIFFTR